MLPLTSRKARGRHSCEEEGHRGPIDAGIHGKALRILRGTALVYRVQRGPPQRSQKPQLEYPDSDQDPSRGLGYRETREGGHEVGTFDVIEPHATQVEKTVARRVQLEQAVSRINEGYQPLILKISPERLHSMISPGVVHQFD